MPDKRIDFLASAACFGAVLTGILGIIVVIISVFSANPLAAGISILGAGLAFGLLAVALLRA